VKGSSFCRYVNELLNKGSNFDKYIELISYH